MVVIEDSLSMIFKDGLAILMKIGIKKITKEITADIILLFLIVIFCNWREMSFLGCEMYIRSVFILIK